MIWKKLYKCTSGIDAGTLFHLRNVINRRNVIKDPAKDFTACEDFFVHVVEAHILTACMAVFKMESLEDQPTEEMFSKESLTSDDTVKRSTLLKAILSVLQEHVSLPSIAEHVDFAEESPKDHVQEYARETLSLGLIFLECQDATREGDGERIIRCWRYLLLIFKESGRTNYSTEAFTLLSQFQFLFSERMQMQIMWCRTVNVHGLPGRNIPCDLFNEHLNRECKESIRGLGSNITDRAIQRIGKSLHSTVNILEAFDKNTGVAAQHGHHTIRSSSEDRKKLISSLCDRNVFYYMPGRAHSNFPNFKANDSKLSNEKFIQWCQERYRVLSTYH